MEPDDDRDLSNLLREWRISSVPRSLDERVSRAGRPWWRVMLTGSIRVPIPVAAAMAAVLLMAGAWLKPRPPVVAPAGINLEQFRPVSDLNVRVIRNDAN